MKKSGKKTLDHWTGYGFNSEEWTLIKGAWTDLIMRDRVILGIEKVQKDNLHLLLNELKQSDSNLGEKIRKGLPSGTKKYKSLHGWVSR